MSVVFLCVGAAKAGTSWLHRQLSAHPECHFRTIKELHYFDAVDNDRVGRQLQHHRAQQIGLLERVTSGGTSTSEEQARRLADRGDWLDVLERQGEDVPSYLDYLHKDAGDARLVGDMTPAYALLSEARLRQMAGMAVDVRFLYLLRDPVERLWSHVRMIAARRDADGSVSERRCGNILARTIRGEESQIAMRSDYASAIARLTSAVPVGRLLIEVFEEMVSGEGLARICDFLGLSRVASDPVPVHAGQPLAMTGDQRAAAAEWLAPQYDAAERALGRMPGGWRRKG